jgi:hypothetical protein
MFDSMFSCPGLSRIRLISFPTRKLGL